MSDETTAEETSEETTAAGILAALFVSIGGGPPFQLGTFEIDVDLASGDAAIRPAIADALEQVVEVLRQPEHPDGVVGVAPGTAPAGSLVTLGGTLYHVGEDLRPGDELEVRDGKLVRHQP